MSGHPNPYKGMKRDPALAAKISAARRAVIPPLETRFWAKVEKWANGCFVWIGAKHRDGYGVFWDGHGAQKAHRMALRFAGIEPPDRRATGLVVDHVCRNRACVNPAHMRIVTQKVNTLENRDRSRDYARIVALPKEDV